MKEYGNTFSKILMKLITLQIQKSQLTTNSLTTKKTTLTYITIKLLNSSGKEKTLNSSWRGKKRYITYLGTKMRLTADFSSGTMKAHKYPSKMMVK